MSNFVQNFNHRMCTGCHPFRQISIRMRSHAVGTKKPVVRLQLQMRMRINPVGQVTQYSGGTCIYMRGSRKFCLRGSNSDNVFFFLNFYLFLLLFFCKGREDQNKTKRVSPFKWRFAGGPMVAQH